MDDKILVLVYVPVIEKEYDIYIPINKKIGTIKNTIIKTIIELSELYIKDFTKMKLYDKKTGSLLDNDVIVKNSGLNNGSKIILM